MSDEYETGKRALAELLDWAASHDQLGLRNEASTRFHLIDRLLEEVLRWPLHQIAVERHHDGKYTDYEVGSAAPAWVLEAKREGNYFELPAGWASPTADLETLRGLGGALAPAIDQALDYSLQRGIPYAAVCNGTQLVAFLGSRQDGVPPRRGRALIYPSLQDMHARFTELWDTLSPAGVAASGLTRTLADQTVLKPPPAKLSSRIPQFPGYKNRNPIATELQILGGLFVEDLANSDELQDDFLRETYCASGALSQYALVSKELLRARYSETFESEGQFAAQPAHTKKGISTDLRNDVLIAGLRKRPVLLVGDVGVGKSMFIRHLVRVAAREELDRAIVLYIDFGSRPALAEDLKRYVVGEIRRQLLDDHNIDVEERQFVRGVYHGDLLRFARGIYADLKELDPAAYGLKELEFLAQKLEDPETHLKACLRHALRGQSRHAVVFLDNVDQRPHHFQEEVFLIAHVFAQTWPATVFVTLRPETYALSRAKGTLAAYQPRVFTIAPPRVDLVISKRLTFALGQLARTGHLGGMPEGFTVTSPTLRNYLEMLGEAFRSNTEIIEFVDNMSNGNIRRALGFIASFVGSGHVDSGKILDIIDSQRRYTLPLHEFLRAVVYGDFAQFNAATSPVVNIFDITSDSSAEHFLLASVLAYVDRQGQIGDAEGYSDRSSIYRYAQGLSFDPRQVEVALSRCMEHGLLSTPMALDGSEQGRFRITTAGAYTFKRLPALFAYVDAVVVDTPITDPAIRAKILHVHTIDDRLDRAELFLQYLDECWRGLDDGATVFDWATLSAELRVQVAGIRLRTGRDRPTRW